MDQRLRTPDSPDDERRGGSPCHGATIHGGASIIVTFNLRHFRPEQLKPWGIVAQHPQSFLCELFQQEQAPVMTKLEQQAADRGRGLRELLLTLNATVPDFVAMVSDAISRTRS